MKRDMEAVREILQRVEACDFKDALMQTYDPATTHHIAIMKEAGLIEAAIVKDHRGIPSQAAVFRLTWEGHEFLDAVREDDIWNKIKQKVIKPGASWTFGFIIEYAKAEIKQRLFPPNAVG